MTRPLLAACEQALSLYGAETISLIPLANQRYDRSVFPTGGQYDWLSASLLYCLIRHLKPARIIEVSTSSGYSTLFSAKALKANGKGKIYTFEINPRTYKAAVANFKNFGVSDLIVPIKGDVRKTIKILSSVRKSPEKEIIFIDTDHTVETTKMLLRLLLKKTSPGSLVHIHDVLPPRAQVSYKPLSSLTSPSFRNRARIYWLARKFLPLPDIRHFLPFEPYEITTSEALYVHKLSDKLPASDQLYVYTNLKRLANYLRKYPEWTRAQKGYLQKVVARGDEKGNLMEWNESWWCRASALKKVV